MSRLCHSFHLSYLLIASTAFYHPSASAQFSAISYRTPSQVLSEQDASDWIQERCMVRTDSRISSFFITEQDGIPNAAEDLQVYLPLDIESLLR